MSAHLARHASFSPTEPTAMTTRAMATDRAESAAGERRKYRLVDDETRDAAIGTVCTAIEQGTSFTAACAVVAAHIGVAATTVRGWVNDSGRRPRTDYDEVLELRRALAAAAELNHRLAAGRDTPSTELR
nr:MULTISPECIES: hypothetical protein [unclassified Rhodococcus (in: high G+C Gram-positive bacteria)]